MKKQETIEESKNNEELKFCDICMRVINGEHICQGSEYYDNQWK